MAASASLSPSQRILRARLGGLATSARHDPREVTAPARRAFAERFYADVPADLPADERERRAAANRRAYFARLAFQSSKVRGKKKAAADIQRPATALEVRRGTDERPQTL
jgi:hypothetical protein